MAEITASDAVEAVLAPLAAAGVVMSRLPSDANLLAEAIEAAQAEVQHPDSGPADPPAVVSSYGEEPDEVPYAAAEPEEDAVEAEMAAEAHFDLRDVFGRLRQSILRRAGGDGGGRLQHHQQHPGPGRKKQLDHAHGVFLSVGDP